MCNAGCNRMSVTRTREKPGGLHGGDSGERSSEAARVSPRGGGWAPGGWASLWECRAAQSRQARAEEAQGASWRPAQGDTLTMLRSARAAAWHTRDVAGRCKLVVW